VYKFEVIVKKHGKEIFNFGITQAELDIADKLGVSKPEFIEQLCKLKAEQFKNEATVRNSRRFG
jgi:hypothetical protein